LGTNIIVNLGYNHYKKIGLRLHFFVVNQKWKDAMCLYHVHAYNLQNHT